LSLGPAGELRYPSYNAAAGWNYPDIGFLQSYSERAQRAFRLFLKQKYKGDIAQRNASWSLHFSNFEDLGIRPPGDGAEFFASGVKTNYGRDFLEWYQLTLERHAETMFRLGQKYLKNPIFSKAKFAAPLGGKIAGIHWKMSDPVYPHAAERAAGYVDYSKFMSIFSSAQVELTFTCMEMNNNDFYPYFSQPQDLVKKILALAADRGIRVNGENALAISNNSGAYSQIRNIFEKSSLRGFTLLRLGQIFSADGKPNGEFQAYRNQVVRSRQQQFLVRTHLNTAEVVARGFEIRIIGTTLNLGDYDPEKGLVLRPAGQYDWVGSTTIPDPDGVDISVILYNPITKKTIHGIALARSLYEQSDKLFLDPFFGFVVTMGSMIPL
jgi:hypothetical protein